MRYSCRACYLDQDSLVDRVRGVQGGGTDGDGNLAQLRGFNGEQHCGAILTPYNNSAYVRHGRVLTIGEHKVKHTALFHHDHHLGEKHT